MRTDELFDPALYVEMEGKGMIRTQIHPSLPLAIACYTKDCVVARCWNEVTSNCRGLIFNWQTQEILARPFAKFFNLGEPDAREDYEAEVEVTDKMDGSLGIGYVWEGKLYIATKGSFASEQAIEANKILQETFPNYLPPGGITPLFEIVYPENRIVLDYGQDRYLALIAGIDMGNGEDDEFGIWQGSRAWPGPSVNVTSYTSLGQAVSSLPRDNAEGWVVRYKDTNERVKIKQQDYIDKHKLVFLLSQKTIWESLKDGRFHEYKAGMPDEFHDWMDSEASKFTAKFEDHLSIIDDCVNSPDLSYLIECAQNGEREARLMIEELISDLPRWVWGAIWCVVDGYDYTKIIYKQFEPKGQTKVAKP